MDKSLNLAEFIGIMMGDGGIYDLKNGKYQTTVTLGSNEYDYGKYVLNLFDSIFENYSFGLVEYSGYFQLRNFSRFVGEQLIFLGLFSGNKVSNECTVPLWIWQSYASMRRCLRGIFDTDGCVYRKYSNYLQIQFKFGCKKTTESVRDLLIHLDFSPTRVHLSKDGKSNGWKFYLSKQVEVNRFFQEIGPANKKHITRFEEFRSGGHARI